MKPGVTNFPEPSITRAPSGTSTEVPGPTAVIRLPSMTIVPFSIGGPPFPSMIVPPTMARAPPGSCAAAGPGADRRNVARVAARMRIGDGVGACVNMSVLRGKECLEIQSFRSLPAGRVACPAFAFVQYE